MATDTSTENAAGYAAITQLTAKYNRIFDSGASDRLAEIFVPDAVLNVGGFEGFRGFDVLGGVAERGAGKFVHVTTDTIVDIHGDHAHQHATLMLFARGEGEAQFARLAYYDDVLVLTPDGWRFASRDVTWL